MKKVLILIFLATVLTATPVFSENPRIQNPENGHFYQAFKTKKSWTEARIACSEIGGHLVTATTEGEQLFLAANFFKDSRQSFWAGATDSGKEGEWRWITGEPFDFQYWQKGEPNDQKDEDFLEMPLYFDYRWNDVPDSAKLNGYVCEWDDKIIPEAEPASSAAEAEPEPTEPVEVERDNPAAENFSYFVPLFEYSENFLTGFGLSNSNVAEEAEISLTVFDESGIEILSEPAVILPDGQKTVVLYPEKSTRGWALIESNQPITGVCFLIASGAGADNFMADIPISRKRYNHLHVPHVTCDRSWDTVLYIANPNDGGQNVYIDLVSPDGLPAASDSVTIPANGCLQYSLSSIISQDEFVGGKIKIFGPKGVTAFALYTNVKTGARSFAGISPMEPF